MNIQALIESAGFTSVANVSKISGGDINAAYRFTAGNQDYFIKVNDAEKFPDLFRNEANGLNEIREKSAFKIPKIITFGERDAFQYLILELLTEGKASEQSWSAFAQNLAQMHKVTQENFGFYEDNYFGSQPQVNTEKINWPQFYAENRILPSIRQMVDKGVGSSKDAANAEKLCYKLPEIYPDERPSLIHGDLWSGNYFIMKNTAITVIDPAVYYGHREMDLAMAMLFGGIPEGFYHSYFEHFPVAPEFSERVEFSQLYPLIFHAIRFGGGYIPSVQRILAKFS